jgi:dihydrofolate reductase
VIRLSVFIASSLDGYIASSDDKLDFLDGAVREGEDYGYDSFIADVDALAMGRGTYDFIAEIDPLPFGGRALYVFTSHPPQPRAGVEFVQWSPNEALEHWKERGLQHIYVDGGNLISRFLAAGLIDDMVLTTAPVLLGSGRPLFAPIEATSKWSLDAVEHFPSGMVNRHYSRIG